MHSESIMAVIDAAVLSIDCCPCGKGLDIVSHAGGLWLECRTYAQPSRLPGWLALALRDLVHERRIRRRRPRDCRDGGGDHATTRGRFRSRGSRCLATPPGYRASPGLWRSSDARGQVEILLYRQNRGLERSPDLDRCRCHGDTDARALPRFGPESRGHHIARGEDIPRPVGVDLPGCRCRNRPASCRGGHDRPCSPGLGADRRASRDDRRLGPTESLELPRRGKDDAGGAHEDVEPAKSLPRQDGSPNVRVERESGFRPRSRVRLPATPSRQSARQTTGSRRTRGANRRSRRGRGRRSRLTGPPFRQGRTGRIGSHRPRSSRRRWRSGGPHRRRGSGSTPHVTQAGRGTGSRTCRPRRPRRARRERPAGPQRSRRSRARRWERARERRVARQLDSA